MYQWEVYEDETTVQVTIPRVSCDSNLAGNLYEICHVTAYQSVFDVLFMTCLAFGITHGQLFLFLSSPSSFPFLNL